MTERTEAHIQWEGDMGTLDELITRFKSTPLVVDQYIDRGLAIIVERGSDWVIFQYGDHTLRVISTSSQDEYVEHTLSTWMDGDWGRELAECITTTLVA